MCRRRLESLFLPVLWKAYNKSPWPTKPDSLGIPSPFVRSPGWEAWHGIQNLHNSARTFLVYCSPVCGSPTQWVWDLILSWLHPLLPSCCSFFFVFGHRLSFFVDYSSLLSMVVQQLVAILELFQEKMSVCPSTLPSWTRSPHCSFGLYLKTAASFSTKDKWKIRALIWSGGIRGYKFLLKKWET